jgi:hypothetical protein
MKDAARWSELSEMAVNEQGPQRLLEIFGEMLQLLDRKYNALVREGSQPAEPNFPSESGADPAPRI